MKHEQECLDYFRSKSGYRHGSLLNGASSAFHAFLLARGFPRGMEVLFPVECYPTLPMLAIEAGLVPRFVDVDVNLNLCPLALRQAMSERVCCVVVIHMAGYPAQMRAIEEVLAGSPNRSVAVVEDWCQAFGTLLKGGIRKRDSTSAVILSFSAGKLISVDGGGLLLSDDPDLIKEAGVIANNGYSRQERFRRIGYSYGMPPIQSSALAKVLPEVDAILGSRERKNRLIRERLASSPFEAMPVHERIHEHKVMARLRPEAAKVLADGRLDGFFDVGEVHYPVRVYDEGFFHAYLASMPGYGPIRDFPNFEMEIGRYFAFRTNSDPGRFDAFLSFAGQLAAAPA